MRPLGLTIHPASHFTGLLVTPPNRSKIGFVVHEAAVEVRFLVRISRLNVDLGGAHLDKLSRNVTSQPYLATTSRVFLS